MWRESVWALLPVAWPGLTQRESLAVAVELGVKNGTIALMVTLTLLESSAMSIPAAVYGVLMFPIGFVLGHCMAGVSFPFRPYKANPDWSPAPCSS